MSKQTNKVSGKFFLFTMLAAMFSGKGLNGKESRRKAYHQSFMEGGNPIFTPNKHHIMSYAQQKRNATKRKNIKKHNTRKKVA